MSNWSKLCHDLLIEIVKHINKIEDFVVFGVVCKTWAVAGSKEYFNGLWLRPRIPYLLLANTDHVNDVSKFYSLVDSEIVASVSIRKFGKRKCYESLGWLLALEEDGSSYLLNPCSSVEIPVPHQSTFPGYELNIFYPFIFVQKFVLSARPSETSDFIVMIICDTTSHLAFWRPEDEYWNKIEMRHASYADVMYEGGHFYAIDCMGYVSVFTLNRGNLAEGRLVTRLIADVTNNFHNDHISNELVDFRNLYILKTSLSLFVITRDAPWFYETVIRSYKNTSKFKVYEIDMSTGKWTEINNIGSMAIFVGHNATFAIDTSGLHGKIKGNHIYFSDDGLESYPFYEGEDGRKDTGVYDLKTRTTEAFYVGEVLLPNICPSLWITP